MRGRQRCGAACLSILTVAALCACSEPSAPGWSGYVEGEYLYLGAPVAGTLSALAVQRGAAVEAGAALFRLDATSNRAARAEADARLQQAQAQATDAAKGRRRDELAVTQAQLAQARAQADRADTELQRQRTLVTQDYISRARLDDAATAAAQAHDRVHELEAALRVARLPARPDQLAAAQAGASAAVQAREQALWREQQAEQQAPTAGRVTETFYRVGEWVPAGQPVLALLPPAGRKARFWVAEAELGGLALGQPVRIRCDGCAALIEARISFIADQAEYTPPVIYSNAQRSRLVFRVEAEVAPADAERLHPGQPIEVQRAEAAKGGT